MKRLKKREVAEGITIYETIRGNKKIFTLDKVDNSKGFILISPLRVAFGNQETLTYLEESGDLSPDDLAHVDDNDSSKYTLCATQWWLVSTIEDSRHKFRKQINFLMEQSFDKYISSNTENDKELIEKDYELKDKRVHKDFITDNIIQY